MDSEREGGSVYREWVRPQILEVTSSHAWLGPIERKLVGADRWGLWMWRRGRHEVSAEHTSWSWHLGQSLKSQIS